MTAAEIILLGALVGSRMVQALATRLSNMNQEKGESLQSNFARFSANLIAYKTISDEKVQYLVGLLKDTPF